VNAVKAVLKRDKSWFMLDEVQDTDCTQFGFFAFHSKFGAGKAESRLTIVGDFDQSIYSFRGATPVALQTQIAALFPGMKAHVLEINYRSTPAIVAACRAIIAPNYTGADACKDLKAHRPSGPPVQLVKCTSIEAEYERIAAEVDAWYAAGVALRRHAAVGKGYGMAVLFWMNTDAYAFSAFLRDRWGKCSPHDSNKVLECREEAGSTAASAEAHTGALFVGTVHAAKGAQFEIVFLAGLGALVPGENSWAPTSSWRKHAKWVAKQFGADQAAADAENRRLQFVAASRPRSLLHVSYAVPANAKPDDEPCAAVGCIRSALGGNQKLLTVLSCGEGEAAALAARFPHSIVDLMGEDHA
jgi:superfamily I DNA/RNA helicase